MAKCLTADEIMSEAAWQTRIMDALMLAITFSKTRAIGLAAPQIGIPLRAVAIVNAPIFYMFNPEIVHKSRWVDTDTEECLSVPGVEVKVPRHRKVKVVWFNRDGVEVESEFSGRLARVVQHEIDHLNGKLIIDYQKTAT